MTLLDKIMNVLTRYDESSSSYITPTQEPFVRKELEEVVKQFEQADEIVRRLYEWDKEDIVGAESLHYGKYVQLIEDCEVYTQSHPAQFGEKKEGGESE